jgi:hypothetical protein
MIIRIAVKLGQHHEGCLIKQSSTCGIRPNVVVKSGICNPWVASFSVESHCICIGRQVATDSVVSKNYVSASFDTERSSLSTWRVTNKEVVFNEYVLLEL